ncbi:hypothetical protein [Nostoc piscinale]|uniref:hypothetical protein n=1 Tax=Nostoc piscinale TaxID=224012 RepID=UPI000A9EEF6D|nr:hypothetical protein [Nostoc piscinale]
MHEDYLGKLGVRVKGCRGVGVQNHYTVRLTLTAKPQALTPLHPFLTDYLCA